jgi:hypothetical protein
LSSGTTRRTAAGGAGLTRARGGLSAVIALGPGTSFLPGTPVRLDRMVVVFGRCERCSERNVVRDDWFICGVCGVDLPARWNFA